MIPAKDNTGQRECKSLSADPAALEQAVLRSLCQPATALPGAMAVCLARYRFRVPLHQVIFDELSPAAPPGCGTSKAELQSRLTRRGFPDVDLSPYYDLPAPSEAELRSAVLRLLDLD